MQTHYALITLRPTLLPSYPIPGTSNAPRRPWDVSNGKFRRELYLLGWSSFSKLHFKWVFFQIGIKRNGAARTDDQVVVVRDAPAYNFCVAVLILLCHRIHWLAVCGSSHGGTSSIRTGWCIRKSVGRCPCENSWQQFLPLRLLASPGADRGTVSIELDLRFCYKDIVGLWNVCNSQLNQWSGFTALIETN